MEEEKINKALSEEPSPAPTAYMNFRADLQSTYIAAAPSSRFNHVGVIAIEKHSTKKERERRAHINTCFCFIHH